MSKINDNKVERLEERVGCDSVVPRSGLHVQMPPGAKAPRSGIYETVGPRGGRTGEQREITRGTPLPPTPANRTWELIKPTPGSTSTSDTRKK